MADIAELEHGLRRAEREVETLRARRAKELADARRMNLVEKRVAELEDFDARLTKSEDEFLARRRSDLAAAQAAAAQREAELLAARQQRAQAADAPRRAQARERWIVAGYDPAEFDAAYDARRKLELLEGADAPSDVRHMLGGGSALSREGGAVDRGIRIMRERAAEGRIVAAAERLAAQFNLPALTWPRERDAEVTRLKRLEAVADLLTEVAARK